MIKQSSILHLLLAALVAGGLISGCSTPKTESAPPCDDASIQQAIEASLVGSQSELVDLEGVECADGWAVAFPTIGDFAGDVAITTTAVLRAEGASWVVVPDRSAVCGAYDPDRDPVNPDYPDDADVPEAIWLLACNTN